MKKLVFALILAIPFLAGCAKNQPMPDIETVRKMRGMLIDKNQVGHDGRPQQAVRKCGTVTKDDVIAMMKLKFSEGEKLPEKLHEQLKYDVEYYNVNYWTQYGLEGSDVRTPDMVMAKALLLVPKLPEGEKHKLAVYFHGTVMPSQELFGVFGLGTPSDFDGSYESADQDLRHCGLPLASAGYCVILPEYTGYSYTAAKDHPFVYYPELVMSAGDAVIASTRALRNPEYGIEIEVPNEIYVTGWSQGGGMALYYQKYIESQNTLGGLKIKATSALAGPYDVKKFIMDVFSKPDTPILMMALYGWAAYAINMFCPDLQRPMDQIFRPSIYDQTDAFLLFGNTPADTFQEFFIQHVADGTDKDFLHALEEDSTHEGWSPRAPIFLHHAYLDGVVPFLNSQSAYDGLKKTSRSSVELIGYGNKTGEQSFAPHTKYVPEYISRTIEEFESLQ